MMVQSTIDKIKDTTILRMIRKMAGVIDEQNTTVENVQQQLDSFDLDGVKTDVNTLKTDVGTVNAKLVVDESQIDANKKNIESLRDANMIFTKQISELNANVTSINEKDEQQDASIINLEDADIASASSTFDNTARKLTISLNPKFGNAITTDVIVPASGETGDEYTATAPIAIANKDISLAIDTDTMEITTDGKLKSKADGKTYVAGSGISIDDTTNAISVDETVIATKATTDNLDTQIKECATGVANAITQAQTANTNALNAYNAVSLSDTHLVLTKGNGNSDEIVLPSGGSDGWEDLDITNLPKDFKENDELLIDFKCIADVTATSWSIVPASVSISGAVLTSDILRTRIINQAYETYTYTPFYYNATKNYVSYINVKIVNSANSWNLKSDMFTLEVKAFNAGGFVSSSLIITQSNIANYVNSIKRKHSSS